MLRFLFVFLCVWLFVGCAQERGTLRAISTAPTEPPPAVVRADEWECDRYARQVLVGPQAATTLQGGRHAGAYSLCMRKKGYLLVPENPK
jgi:hypothetical protein